jgi:surfeit locus 1 family protein
MKRIPVIATLIVIAAVALMLRLGFWQLERSEVKAALLANYQKASSLPEMAFPAIPVGDQYLFRKASGLCIEPVQTTVEAGRSRTGASGWRHVARCRTGVEGPGMMVDIGWSRDFAVDPHWRGGPVSGMISAQPDHRSLISKAFGPRSATPLMLIAATPAAKLEPSATPSLQDIPNNHFGYAVQWFAFAGIAALIYAVALRRRLRA